MKTIDKIITKVNCTYGAPMGRSGVHDWEDPPDDARVYDCAVPMSGDGSYDRGGAYWGLPVYGGAGCGQLRVKYTKDLTYIKFYRK